MQKSTQPSPPQSEDSDWHAGRDRASLQKEEREKTRTCPVVGTLTHTLQHVIRHSNLLSCLHLCLHGAEQLAREGKKETGGQDASFFPFKLEQWVSLMPCQSLPLWFCAFKPNMNMCPDCIRGYETSCMLTDYECGHEAHQESVIISPLLPVYTF